jgi:hypothetical protein
MSNMVAQSFYVWVVEFSVRNWLANSVFACDVVSSTHATASLWPARVEIESNGFVSRPIAYVAVLY